MSRGTTFFLAMSGEAVTDSKTGAKNNNGHCGGVSELVDDGTMKN